MRIIQVIAAKGYGGAEYHTQVLARGLLAAGHDVVCIVPKRSWIGEECRKLGIPCKTMTFHGTYDFFAVWLLRRFIKRWQADIVHGQLTRASRYVNIATKGTAAVPINTCHATSSHKHMQGSRKIIAVSRAVRQTLLDHDYPEEKIEVIYNGVPPARQADRQATRHELGIPDGVFAVVCVGRMISCKGQIHLVEIIDSLPERIHIYFIGGTDTPYGEKLLALAGNDPRLHFLGFRADVPRILGAFDLCAAPSAREALSIALIEASQAGLPMVANRVGGIPEVVIEGRSGMLVSRANNQQLAENIASMANNPAMLTAFGKQARETYETTFTSDRMLSLTQSLYENVISGKSTAMVAGTSERPRMNS